MQDPRIVASQSDPIWDAERDDRLLCRAIFDETADVRTFVFAPVAPARFRYDPGQFLNFEMEIDGVAHTRSYTLASSPARPERISITVKRIPGGVVSPYLHDRLRPGAILRAAGPLGDFSTARVANRKHLFLSAGVGVTPLMSMARSSHDRAEDCDVVFVHSARGEENVIFRQELDLMARRSDRFRTSFTITGATPSAAAGARGRITTDMLQAMCPDLMGREIFCCGPEGFMAHVRAMLAGMRFDQARYHEESFVFANAGASLPDAPTNAETRVAAFNITFAKSGRTIACATDTPILTAARQAGIPLPSSCTKGLCGTCKSRKLHGDVDMKHQGGIRPREIHSGLVLLCCSKPLSDVTIDR
jgi:ferredoxin-NADP reductase